MQANLNKKDKEIDRYTGLHDQIKEWEKKTPGRIETIFRSIANVSLSQLADTSLFPFQELRKNTSKDTQLDLVELI